MLRILVAVLVENLPIIMRIFQKAWLRKKVENYLASEADLLLLCEPGCLLNIGGYLSRHHPQKKIMHLASFLADYRREKE